jgi:hypothetical protein
MTDSKEFEELLKNAGISLATLGLRDIGLLRNDALRAVEILRNTNLPILGGDVYFRRKDRIKFAYANWIADPNPSEDRETYLRRSWDTTEAYLRSFPESSDTEPLFVIVVPRRKDQQWLPS